MPRASLLLPRGGVVIEVPGHPDGFEALSLEERLAVVFKGLSATATGKFSPPSRLRFLRVKLAELLAHDPLGTANVAPRRRLACRRRTAIDTREDGRVLVGLAGVLGRDLRLGLLGAIREV